MESGHEIDSARAGARAAGPHQSNLRCSQWMVTVDTITTWGLAKMCLGVHIPTQNTGKPGSRFVVAAHDTNTSIICHHLNVSPRDPNSLGLHRQIRCGLEAAPISIRKDIVPSLSILV